MQNHEFAQKKQNLKVVKHFLRLKKTCWVSSNKQQRPITLQLCYIRLDGWNFSPNYRNTKKFGTTFHIHQCWMCDEEKMSFFILKIRWFSSVIKCSLMHYFMLRVAFGKIWNQIYGPFFSSKLWLISLDWLRQIVIY